MFDKMPEMSTGVVPDIVPRIALTSPPTRITRIVAAMVITPDITQQGMHPTACTKPPKMPLEAKGFVNVLPFVITASMIAAAMAITATVPIIPMIVFHIMIPPNVLILRYIFVY